MDELEEAIKLLRQMYNLCKNHHHVRNPMAFALYHTWKEFDKKEHVQEKFFDTCPNCGAILDPNETCECEKTPICASKTIKKHYGWDNILELIYDLKELYVSSMKHEPRYLKISWDAFVWLKENHQEIIRQASMDYLTACGLICCPTTSLHGLEGIEVF